MCKGRDYRQNCGNCAYAAEKVHEDHCGPCLTLEMETKVAYQGWQPKK